MRYASAADVGAFVIGGIPHQADELPPVAGAATARWSDYDLTECSVSKQSNGDSCGVQPIIQKRNDARLNPEFNKQRKSSTRYR